MCLPFKKGKVNLYKAFGGLVIEKNISTNQAKLDLSSFENGLYVVEVILEDRFVLRETVLKVSN